MKGVIVKENKERVERIFKERIEAISKNPFAPEDDIDLEWAMKITLGILQWVPTMGDKNETQRL